MSSGAESEFDSAEPSGDEIKEVYAYFGAAYYFSECLNRQLCNAYALVSLKDEVLFPGHALKRCSLKRSP